MEQVQDAAPDERLIDLAEVKQRTTMGKTFIYKLIAQGDFPRPVILSGRRVAWSLNEILGWIEKRKSDARAQVGKQADV
jgi:prophage regulatory protein